MTVELMEKGRQITARTTRKAHAPGKSYRDGISIIELMKMFSTNAKAERWFQERIWQGTPRCPHCGSAKVNLKAKHVRMPHRCREKDCYKFFSIKTGTVMEASNISCKVWAIANYLYHTNLKGISSMRLHRELNVTQKTAWFLLKGLREADGIAPVKFSGVVEVDETYIGPKVHRMNSKQKAQWDDEFKGSRGTAGRIPVACIRERAAGRVRFAVLPDTTGETFKQFVLERTEDDTGVQTDEARQYKGLDKLNRIHTTVNHSEKEYVRYEKDADGEPKFVTANGCEATFGTLKNNIAAVFHRVTNKRGIFPYVLDGRDRHLNIRACTDTQKRTAWERQERKCPKIDKVSEFTDTHADHRMPRMPRMPRIPWSRGGKTELDNCRIPCRECNLTKGDR